MAGLVRVDAAIRGDCKSSKSVITEIRSLEEPQLVRRLYGERVAPEFHLQP